MSAVLPPPQVEYPESDGQPMAETGVHVQAIILLHQALQDFFADRPDVFIASDTFWYWKEGDAEQRTAPDVMVVPGVGNHQRRTFRSFDENGAIPAVVFEMASKGTWQDDEEDKYADYERLGVREYVMFDPEGLYLSSQIKAYRLNNTAYRRLYPRDGVIESELGFRMRAEGTMLRLIDTRTGGPVPTREERAIAAERRAEQEKQRADALQAELDRLKAQLQPPPSGNTP